MKCRNYQELKIQEQVQRLAVGTIPRSMWVVLMDDLVDTCKPGDDVTVWYVVVVVVVVALLVQLQLLVLLVVVSQKRTVPLLFFYVRQHFT